MSFLDRARSLFRARKDPTRTIVRAMRAASGENLKLGMIPLSRQLQRVGQITPEHVRSAIRSADTGQMAPLCDLFNESRQKDCHIHGVLEKREGGISELSWTLRYPNQDEKSTRGARQRKFAEEVIRGIGNLDTALEHLCGAIVPGYAVVEIPWTKRDDGKIVATSLVCHAPRRFGFRRSDTKLVLNDDTMEEVDFQGLWPDNFIVSQPRVTGDVPQREGLARILLWAALFRNWTLADWLKLGELGWKPWRTGKYNKDASDEDIENLRNILENMTADGCAVYPATTEVDFEWPGGQTPSRASHSELFAVVGAEASKAVLGNTLTTEAGKNGTQSLGVVQERAEIGKTKKDARRVSAAFTEQFVAPLIRMNFGANSPVPEFVLIVEERVDIATFGSGIADLAKAGLRMRSKWVRDEIGMGDPEEDEETFGTPELPDPNDPADPSEPTEDPADANGDDESKQAA